jgi:hypothetical protein
MKRLLAAALGFVAAPFVLMVLYYVAEYYRPFKPSRKPRRIY